ncbi:hypothetical protein EJB05_09607, partial [Eragrostis curvula]
MPPLACALALPASLPCSAHPRRRRALPPPQLAASSSASPAPSSPMHRGEMNFPAALARAAQLPRARPIICAAVPANYKRLALAYLKLGQHLDARLERDSVGAAAACVGEAPHRRHGSEQGRREKTPLKGDEMVRPISSESPNNLSSLLDQMNALLSISVCLSHTNIDLLHWTTNNPCRVVEDKRAHHRGPSEFMK